MRRHLLFLVAACSLLSSPAIAQRKPIVQVDGIAKPLPDGDTVAVTGNVSVTGQITVQDKLKFPTSPSISGGGTTPSLVIGTSVYPTNIGGSGAAKYDATSNVLTNVIGAKYGLFGVAAKDNVQWANSYVSGIDVTGHATVFAVSPTGYYGSFGASRSSDSTNANANVVGAAGLSVCDNVTTSLGQLCWGQYSASYTVANALFQAAYGHEITMRNGYADAAMADPYAYNNNQEQDVIRLTCGDGATTSYKCSAFAVAAFNGSPAEAGLVFGSTALDTTSGPAPMLSGAMNHSINWYGAAGKPTWRVFSNTGNGNHMGQMVLGDDTLDVYLQNGAYHPLSLAITGSKLAGKVKVLPSATSGNWVSGIYNGVYSYMGDNASVSAPISGSAIGVYSDGRSSDTFGTEFEVTIPFASFVNNDKVAGISGVWNFYGTAVRAAGANGPTHAIELDVTNKGAIAAMTPANINPGGLTNGIRIMAGGEAAEATDNPSSAALVIGSNDPTYTNNWLSGIVFHNRGIYGTNGDTGVGSAIQLATGHQITWMRNDGLPGGYISSVKGTGSAGLLNLGSYGSTGSGFNLGLNTYGDMTLAADTPIALGTASKPWASVETNVMIAKAATVGGTMNTGYGVSTGTASLELGGLRSGTGASFIDFHSVSGTDFDSRIMRNPGANGTLDISNTGTGAITVSASGVIGNFGNPSIPGGLNYPSDPDSFTSQVDRMTLTGTRTKAQIARTIEITDGQSGPQSSQSVITPGSASYGLSITGYRPNWQTSGITGEMDGISVVLRQASSDTAALLSNVGVRNGFGATVESYTFAADVNANPTMGIRTQLGMVNPRDGNAMGLGLAAENGTNLTAGLYIYSSQSTAAWVKYIEVKDPTGAAVFNIRGSDGATFTRSVIPTSRFSGNLGAPAQEFDTSYSKLIKLVPLTYAGVQADHPCNSGNTGFIARISDSAAAVTTFNQTITAGGGTNSALMTCDGANWRALSS